MATPQNGQTYSSDSSAKADWLFECVWPFCDVDAKRVKIDIWETQLNNSSFWGSLGEIRQHQIKAAEKSKQLEMFFQNI